MKNLFLCAQKIVMNCEIQFNSIQFMKQGLRFPQRFTDSHVPNSALDWLWDDIFYLSPDDDLRNKRKMQSIIKFLRQESDLFDSNSNDLIHTYELLSQMIVCLNFELSMEESFSL